jgi:carboxypeptidase C (cathepsin A)
MYKKIHQLPILILALILVSSHAAVTVNKLNGISAHNLVYSGYLPISDTSSDRLFFTYYGMNDVQSETDLKNNPLIIVVGSPGSSAQFINFAGMGPVLLNPDMTTQTNS